MLVKKISMAFAYANICELERYEEGKNINIKNNSF